MTVLSPKLAVWKDAQTFMIDYSLSSFDPRHPIPTPRFLAKSNDAVAPRITPETDFPR